MMIYIPLPLLLRARLPPKRKAILCGVFSLGFLVILSAILNRYYNFTAGYGSLIYLNWYVGEAATSVFVANVPHLWPLLSRAFALSAFFSSSSRRRTTQEGGSESAAAGGEAGGTCGKMGKRKSRSRILGSRSKGDGGYLRTESREEIAKKGSAWPLSSELGHTSVADERSLELEPLEGKGLGYAATAAGGVGCGDGGLGGGMSGEEKQRSVGDLGGGAGGRGIVRTVQIRQYSSENV